MDEVARTVGVYRKCSALCAGNGCAGALCRMMNYNASANDGLKREMIGGQMVLIGVTPKRLDKSLSIMTLSVVELLKKSPTGILNLGEVAKALEVRQKRRIYDVTNVLEGIGLIEKCGKNSVKWRGDDLPRDPRDIAQRRKTLAQENQILCQRETALNYRIACMKQSMKMLQTDDRSASFAFVTSDDLITAVGSKQNVLVISKQQQPFHVVQSSRTVTISSSSGLPLNVRVLKDPFGRSYTRPSRLLRVEQRMRMSTKTALERELERAKESAINEHKNVLKRLKDMAKDGSDGEIEHEWLLQQEREYDAQLLLGRDYSGYSLYRRPDRIATTEPHSVQPFTNAPFVPVVPPDCISYSFTLHPSEGVFDLFDIDIDLE